MEEIIALRNLIDHKATEEEIEFLRQRIVLNEIRIEKQEIGNRQIEIGGSVSNSIIILGDGNSIQISSEVLEALGARPILDENSDESYIGHLQYSEEEARLYFRKFLRKNKETPSQDPYADYLIAQFTRIDQFLKTTFQIASGGFPDTHPLQLHYKPHFDVVNETFQIVPQTQDPLISVIGKRYDPPRKEYSDLRTAFQDYQGRLLLLGEGGSGKTISLFMFARDCIIRRLQNPSNPLPIMGIVPKWNYHERPDMSAWLQASYGAPHNVAEIIDNGNAILILDGLDELVPELNTTIDPQALFLEQLPLNNQVVMTCRTHTSGFLKRELKLHGAISVLPLSRDQITAHLSQFPRLGELLKPEDRETSDLLNTPFMLTLFTESYAGANSAELEQFKQKSDPFKLKRQIIQRALQRRWGQISDGYEKAYTYADLNRGLGIIAYEILMLGPIGNPSALEIKTIHRKVGKQTEALLEIANRMGILVQSDKTTWRFAHAFYKNYFALQYCIEAMGEIAMTNRGPQKLQYITTALEFEEGQDSKYSNRRLVIDCCKEKIASFKPDGGNVDEIVGYLNVLTTFEASADYAFEELLASPNDLTRFNALYALTNDLQPFAIPILETALPKMSAEGRYAALGTLTELREPLLIPVFISQLLEPEPAIRLLCIDGITKTGEPVDLEGLSKNTNNQVLLDALEKCRTDPRTAIEYLLEQINSNGWQDNVLALLALVQLADVHTFQRIKDMLHIPPESELEHIYYWIMGQIALRFPASARALLRDENSQYRMLGVKFLSQIKDAESRQLILDALEDPDPRVKFEVARALIGYGPEIFDKLEELAFQVEVDDRPNRDLMQAIPGIITKCLAELSKEIDRELGTRQILLSTLLALAGMISESNLPTIIDALSSPNIGTRAWVRTALMLAGNHSLEPMIHAFQTHVDKNVREELGLILSDLGIELG